MDGSFNAQFVFYSILAGLVGAFGMTLVLGLFGKVGWTRANLVVALGTLFSRNRNSALMIGATVHGIAGIVFAMIYTSIFALFNLSTATAILFVGLGLGWAHGIVASLIFVVSTVLGNPEGELKKVQFSGGPAYMLAHMVYGLLVGLVIGISPLLTGGAAGA
jgi:hypothetical protein